MFGLAAASALLTNHIGYSSVGWGYNAGSGQKFNNNVGATFGAVLTTGDVIGIAVDMDDGKVWWAKNNVWQGGGDPALGTSPAYSNLAGLTVYPAVSCFTNGTVVTAKMDLSELSYPPPSGFSPINSQTWQLRATLDQQYALLSNFFLAALDQFYSLTEKRLSVLDQIYSLRMLVVLSQLYGNAPRYRAKLSQHYGDFFLFRRIFTQNYGDAARYRQQLEQGWDMPEGLRRMFEQRYSISEAGYRAMLDHIYDLSDMELLRAQLDQLYVLAAGEALVQRTDQAVYCAGVEHTSAYNIMIEQDEALFYMVGELQLADESEFLQYRAFETDVVIEVDARQYHFIVDADPRRSRQPGESIFVVPLVSKTVLLDSPHSVITSESLSGMAADLVAVLAAPFTVDWQLVNWFIPPNILQSNGESAISIIRRIVAAAGGIVQTSPAGVLVCRAEYPVSVGEWPSATPDLELTDQDDFFQIDPSPDPRPGYNVFFLTNQSLAADGVSLDIVNVSATQNELRVSMLPWSDSARVVMHHSGGSWVQVVDQGIVIETITEQVEIIAGAGQTTKPIFVYLGHGYSVVDLGAVEVAEAGNVTTAVAENSLLQLTYQTRYWSFLATDQNIEDVQFFPEIIES